MIVNKKNDYTQFLLFKYFMVTIYSILSTNEIIIAKNIILL